MRKIKIFNGVVLSLLTILIAASATAKTAVVGTCLHNPQTYSTISQAVSSVAAGSTILVCPGTYPEQVLITQPLTLRGVVSGNSANPVITAPTGGLSKFIAAPDDGIDIHYQIGVQNTTSNPVTIANIAVDGSNNKLPSDASVVGIYYDNSSGLLSHDAVFNQHGTGAGYAVVVGNTNSSSITFSVLDCSIHDFDQGAIQSVGNVAATFQRNVISASDTLSSAAPPSAIILNSGGVISGNQIDGQNSLYGTAILVSSNATVTNNTARAFGIGIMLLGNSNTVKSNKVSLSYFGIIIVANDNDVEYNTIANSPGGVGINFYACDITGNTVIHNSVNDTADGITNSSSGNTISPNSFFNVASVISAPCSADSQSPR